MTVPKVAASIAFTFRIGGAYEQWRLFGDAGPSGVIDEMMTCVEMACSSRYEKLKEKIPNNDYYTNFIGLTRELSGSDDNIYVGLAASVGTDVRRVEVRCRLLKLR